MTRNILKYFIFGTILIPFAGTLSAKEVNLYSYRQPFLINQILKHFTKQTGIKVNVVYAKKGMLERLKAEGRNTPADAVLTVDISRLSALADAGLLQSVTSAKLEENIPPQYRHPDGLWFGLTLRARVAYAHKERVKDGEIKQYTDLIKPRFKGRVCTRSGKHAYNLSLLAAVIEEMGEKRPKIGLVDLNPILPGDPRGMTAPRLKPLKRDFAMFH